MKLGLELGLGWKSVVFRIELGLSYAFPVMLGT